MGGKTTNLVQLHRTLPPDRRGRLTSLAGDGERTLFFDFMAFELGVVAGLSTHFHLYTVPGQPELAASRRAVLRGADGLVVVVDSDPRRLPGLDRRLTPGGCPAFPARAREGEGVRDCLTAIFKLTIANLGRARQPRPTVSAPVTVGAGAPAPAPTAGAPATAAPAPP